MKVRIGASSSHRQVIFDPREAPGRLVIEVPYAAAHLQTEEGQSLAGESYDVVYDQDGIFLQTRGGTRFEILDKHLPRRPEMLVDATMWHRQFWKFIYQTKEPQVEGGVVRGFITVGLRQQGTSQDWELWADTYEKGVATQLYLTDFKPYPLPVVVGEPRFEREEVV